jgi:pre-rRNA-processing protein TSR1
MAVDEDTGALEVLDAPTSDQDDLQELAPEEAVMEDIPDNISEAPTAMSESRKGVLLDDHHYFDDEETANKAYEMPKKLPAGTSKYQSAWFIDGEDYGSDVGGDSEDEKEDEDMDTDAEARPEDGMEGLAGPTAPTIAGTVYGDDAKSEMFLDPSPEQEFAAITAFRNRQKELEEDREFPDEIELPPNVLARERLARYRGLKSLRSSKWEISEDRPWQPEDWERLARIKDYRGTKNRCINEALAGGVAPGTKVLVYLRNGSADVVEAFRPERPMVLWGLLRHEHKQAVVNVSVTASTDYEGEPVKSKDELIVQIGARRLHVNPIFSVASGTGSNNVSKFERFLMPGRTSVATFVGPVTWGSVPVVAWKRGDGETDWELVGQGSFLNVDRERVVAKRIVLTGHPFKIHKRLVTVRYMFFNEGKPFPFSFPPKTVLMMICRGHQLVQGDTAVHPSRQKRIHQGESGNSWLLQGYVRWPDQPPGRCCSQLVQTRIPQGFDGVCGVVAERGRSYGFFCWCSCFSFFQLCCLFLLGYAGFSFVFGFLFVFACLRGLRLDVKKLVCTQFSVGIFCSLIRYSIALLNTTSDEWRPMLGRS